MNIQEKFKRVNAYIILLQEYLPKAEKHAMECAKWNCDKCKQYHELLKYLSFHVNTANRKLESIDKTHTLTFEELKEKGLIFSG